MKPELQQDGSTQERASGETSSQQMYRRALRTLAIAYERIMSELASKVCESETELMVGGNEFLLGELENNYVHRIRDLQTLIGSLRNQIQSPSPTLMVDELRSPQGEARAALAQWLAERPGVEIVQVVTVPAEGDEVLIMPLYYGTAS